MIDAINCTMDHMHTSPRTAVQQALHAVKCHRYNRSSTESDACERIRSQACMLLSFLPGCCCTQAAPRIATIRNSHRGLAICNRKLQPQQQHYVTELNALKACKYVQPRAWTCMQLFYCGKAIPYPEMGQKWAKTSATLI